MPNRHGRSRLVDALVSNITGLDVTEPVFSRLQHIAAEQLRTLYLSADPFNVEEKLQGHVEKFRVLYQQDRGDALESCLGELKEKNSDRTAFVDILALLLHLSNKPLEGDVACDGPPVEEDVELPPLTWDQIVADDPIEGDHWQVNTFRHLGKDQGVYASDSEEEELPPPRIPRWETAQRPVARRIRVDDSLAEDLASNQYFDEDRLVLTELEAIREVLLVLKTGVSGYLFLQTKRGISVRSNFRLHHTTPELLESVLGWLAEQVSAVLVLRKFAAQARGETITLEAFAATVSDELHALDLLVVDIELELLNIKASETVYATLLGLKMRLEPQFERLSVSVKLVKDVLNRPYQNPRQKLCQLLSDLYDIACRADMTANQADFDACWALFMPTLRVYLEQLAMWCNKGELPGSDRSDFFVEQTKDGSEEGVYVMMHHEGSADIMVPDFARQIAEKAFKIGKGVNFLKRLGQAVGAADILVFDIMPELEALKAAHRHEPLELAVGIALDTWVSEAYDKTKTVLRALLIDKLGLWNHLHAMEALYFHRGGLAIYNFTLGLFDKMDRGQQLDRHILTRLVRSALQDAPVAGLAPERITAVMNKRGLGVTIRRNVTSLSAISVDYQLPPLLTHIFTPAAFEGYKKIFMFLTQLQRSKYLLGRLSLIKETDLVGTALDPKSQSAFYGLRLKLFWFTSVMLHHLSVLVLELRMTKLHQAMEEAGDMDEMCRAHSAFMKVVTEECFLSEKMRPLYQAITSILNISVTLADSYMVYTGETTMNASSRSIRSISKRRRRRRPSDATSDESGSSNDEYADASTYISFAEESWATKLEKMHASFERHFPFLQSGVAGLARISTTMFGMLSESLDRSGEQRI
ncbi:hypothetical protein SAICODRAFT_6457 [Saitoella complicata NRRL Y-17804]|uniref:Spindle pole body component n=1 Tax=Saitoella complicata (strain BCRC 22490 / CBS 7301 / JCM 7358 / NBRC 10748 / NRRL Y-17804) TaxID=698492 RepID=A0A0E9NRJ4_SAICN|nr:uncharacterized protein SAICODRAFT_6457 [Saitoella complicata NRRL Y-17804]ODQ54164.1 hypothetical protein SAICODRAFT_6457 [Saitoella complicata NRRL Y-17804]GAO52311.1 hypothetical protein G7K_6390-t1 [Saitoella complicata NRRL Y-17804]